MKKFLLLFTVLFALAFSAQAQKIYSVYTESNKTLTFYFDNRAASRNGEVFFERTDYDNPAPQNWADIRAGVKTIVFDSSFSAARPKSMCHWFDNFFKLEKIQGMENLNTSEVTDMSGLFAHCIALERLDLSYFNTRNVTSMEEMFSGCKSLIALDSLKFNTWKVTSMKNMFKDCESLTKLDLTTFNAGNVTDMSYMFDHCLSLRTIYVDGNGGWKPDRNNDGVFWGCQNLVGGNGTEYDADIKNGSYARVDRPGEPGYFTDPRAPRIYCLYTANDHTLTFYYDEFSSAREKMGGSVFFRKRDWTELNKDVKTVVFTKSFADARPGKTQQWFHSFFQLERIVGIENLNTSEVVNMSAMFYGCERLQELDVTHFDTRKVTDMSSMFSDCHTLKTLDMRSFNTELVESMHSMFYADYGLESIDNLNVFRTCNVKDMAYMFWSCSGLTSLDLSSFDTGNVTDMHLMFENCYKLERIYVSEWATWSLEKSYEMFSGTPSLIGGNGTESTAGHIDAEYARIDKPGEPGYFTLISSGYPTSITLDNNQLHVYDLNKTSWYLTATLGGNNVSHKKITWTSSNTDVATVNASGGIYALKYGETVITATTENGLTASCKVTVEQRQAVYPRSLSFTRPVCYLYEGDSQKLEFELEPKYANQFTFTSTNPNIVEVTDDGTVTAKQPGICRVIVSWTSPDGLTHNDVCRVEVTAR